MTTVTVYTTDTMRIYSGSIELDEMGKMPMHSTLTPPPDGQFAQLHKDGWVVLDAYPESKRDPQEVKNTKWEEIKSIRDRLTQQGGYKAQGKWFHSDTFSRSQQLGLVIMGSSIPAGLQWKTMDGSFVEMTPALSQVIFQAAALQDDLVFSYAEQLNQQVQSSDKPASIDISQGWPETYQEV